MMSRHLGVVYTKHESPVQGKFGSGARLCSLALAGALLLGAGLVATSADAQQVGPQLTQAHAASAARTAPAAASAAVAPDVPAAPIVTYVDGQLTILAENVSLSQVLTLLRSAMGTQVDAPAGSADERVWAHLGPGPAHKVLSDLFANTDLDYILQSSSSDPNAIRMLTLSVRSQDSGKSAPTGVESASEGHRPPRYVAPVAMPVPAAEPEPTPAPQEASAASAAPGSSAPGGDSSSASASAGPATLEPPPTSSPAPVQANMEPTGPSNVFPQTPQPSAGGFNPHPTAPPNMSSDQMVQQLTNMYQQRRQMQTGQTSSTPN